MIKIKKNEGERNESKIQTLLTRRRKRESIETIIIGINIFPLRWMLGCVRSTNVIKYGRSFYLIDRIKNIPIRWICVLFVLAFLPDFCKHKFKNSQVLCRASRKFRFQSPSHWMCRKWLDQHLVRTEETLLFYHWPFNEYKYRNSEWWTILVDSFDIMFRVVLQFSIGIECSYNERNSFNLNFRIIIRKDEMQLNYVNTEHPHYWIETIELDSQKSQISMECYKLCFMKIVNGKYNGIFEWPTITQFMSSQINILEAIFPLHWYTETIAHNSITVKRADLYYYYYSPIHWNQSLVAHRSTEYKNEFRVYWTMRNFKVNAMYIFGFLCATGKANVFFLDWIRKIVTIHAPV